MKKWFVEGQTRDIPGGSGGFAGSVTAGFVELNLIRNGLRTSSFSILLSCCVLIPRYLLT